MDRHVYAWHADGTPVAGFPVLVVDRVEGRVDRPADPRGHVQAPTPAPSSTRARSSTRPRSATSTATASRRSSSAPTRSTTPAHDGGFNAGNAQRRLARRCSASRASSSSGNSRASTRSSPTGDAGRPDGQRPDDPFLPGWPVKVGIAHTELLPVVGEGITGRPVIGPVDLPERRRRRRRSARSPTPGPPTSSTPTAAPATARPSGHGQRAADRLRGQRRASTTRRRSRRSAIPAFGDLGGRRRRPSSTPARGLIRALDLARQRVPGRPGLHRRLGHRAPASSARASRRR